MLLCLRSINLAYTLDPVDTQESSSEAINAYYGVYLLGLARGDAALRDWGRLLLATELHSTRAYYHIASTDKPQIYPPPFAANKVVGVLWNSLVRAPAPGFLRSCCQGAKYSL